MSKIDHKIIEEELNKILRGAENLAFTKVKVAVI